MNEKVEEVLRICSESVAIAAEALRVRLSSSDACGSRGFPSKRTISRHLGSLSDAPHHLGSASGAQRCFRRHRFIVTSQQPSLIRGDPVSLAEGLDIQNSDRESGVVPSQPPSSEDHYSVSSLTVCTSPSRHLQDNGLYSVDKNAFADLVSLEKL